MHACVATLESLFGSVNYSHEVVGVRTAAEGDSKKTLGRLPTNFARQKFEVARGRRRRMKEGGRTIPVISRLDRDGSPQCHSQCVSSLHKSRPCYLHEYSTLVVCKFYLKSTQTSTQTLSTFSSLFHSIQIKIACAALFRNSRRSKLTCAGVFPMLRGKREAKGEGSFELS